jgi:hypothetical protein
MPPPYPQRKIIINNDKVKKKYKGKQVTDHNTAKNIRNNGGQKVKSRNGHKN